MSTATEQRISRIEERQDSHDERIDDHDRRITTNEGRIWALLVVVGFLLMTVFGTASIVLKWVLQMGLDQLGGPR